MMLRKEMSGWDRKVLPTQGGSVHLGAEPVDPRRLGQVCLAVPVDVTCHAHGS